MRSNAGGGAHRMAAVVDAGEAGDEHDNDKQWQPEMELIGFGIYARIRAI